MLIFNILDLFHNFYNKNTKNNSIFVRETKNRKNSNSIAYV